MKKSLLSVALCVMTLLIGISPVSAQGQNKEYQETLHKMLLLSGGLATVDTMVPQIIGMMKQQVPAMPDSVSRQIEDEAAVPLCIGGHVERSNGKGKAVFQR
mgnify:CR=1 FL=1